MKRKGFTLIELIVVIAIIGILATIILVAVSNQAPKAQRAAAVETANRLHDAISICEGSGGTVAAPTAASATAAGGGNAICTGSTEVTTVWPVIPKGTASSVVPVGTLGSSTCGVVYTTTSPRIDVSGTTCNTTAPPGNITCNANGCK